MIDPQAFPIWINLLLFAVAAVLIWAAGTRLARYAERISERTGLGDAFVGAIFLAVATSLSDGASVLTATFAGDASLAVNNLLGGIMLETSVLVVADWVSRGKALTHFVARSVLLLQGLLVIVLLGLTLTGIGVGDLQLPLGIGIWPLLIIGSYLLGLHLVRIYSGDEKWQVVDEDAGGDEPDDRPRDEEEPYSGWSDTRLYLAFAGGSAVILCAGIVIGRTGDALAGQTGLGGNFIGITLLALATALPELSTTVSAARIGAYSLAVSNVFGSTMLSPVLLLPADLIYESGPVLDEVGRSSILAAGAGIIITAIYLIGLIEHRDRTIFRLGFDSAAVLVILMATFVVQYFLR